MWYFLLLVSSAKSCEVKLGNLLFVGKACSIYARTWASNFTQPGFPARKTREGQHIMFILLSCLAPPFSKGHKKHSSNKKITPKQV